MTMAKAYLSIDALARHAVLGHMDGRGRYLGDWRFRTCEAELVKHVANIEAGKKYVAVEEGPLAYWIAQTLDEYVHEVTISDPRANVSISRNPHKKDEADTYQLCRLLRLGELKEVYHPQDDRRAVFKAAVQHYIDLRDQEVKLKVKIKAKYRGWGVPEVDGTLVYSERHRRDYLQQIDAPPIRHQLQRLYGLLDEALRAQESALKEVTGLGRSYPEIKEFEKIPGVGTKGAHIFDAYIQTPDRFATKQQVWRYAKLGITNRSSDNKPLGFKRLDRSGNAELKAMSYWAWKGSLWKKDPDNEVRRFYQRSLSLTHNKVHARLNTQRKILSTMWGLWKRKESYRPELFCPSD